MPVGLRLPRMYLFCERLDFRVGMRLLAALLDEAPRLDQFATTL